MLRTYQERFDELFILDVRNAATDPARAAPQAAAGREELMLMARKVFHGEAVPVRPPRGSGSGYGFCMRARRIKVDAYLAGTRTL